MKKKNNNDNNTAESFPTLSQLQENDAQQAMGKALAAHIGCDWSELEPSLYFYGLDSFEFGREEWAVGSDDDAREAVRNYVEDSAWAFNSSFILGATGLPSAMGIALDKMKEDCEGANEAVVALISATCGMDHFVEEAIRCDGRGHFLSFYDGEEVELKTPVGTFYAYRIN